MPPKNSKSKTKAFARPAVQVEEPISETLQSAIFEVDSAYLRTSVLALCKRKYDGAVFNKTLEEWLVTRITNTKAAEEEEDDVDDEDQEDEEDEEIVEDEALKRWVVDRIGNNKDAEEHEDEEDDEIKEKEEDEIKEETGEADSDKEEIAELATCEYCNEEFDLLENESKDCLRHTGRKELYDDDDFWADHYPDCHGDPEDFIDDEDFAAGFIYSCCQQTSDKPGCKPTRHNAALITESYRPTAGVKRKVTYVPVRSSKAKRVKMEPQW